MIDGDRENLVDGSLAGKDDHTEAEEIVRKAAVMNRPYTPTQMEIEEHMPLHIPYRSWCPHCVAGKGVSGHHRHGEKDDRIGVTISFDYCFMSSAERSDSCCSVLIMFDNVLETIWALPVTTKGPNKAVVDWCVSKLDEAGYRGQPITLKSDGEPAVTALGKAIAVARIGATPLIEAPVRESKGNGAVEAAVKVFAGQLRTFKHQYEYMIGLHAKDQRLSTEHAMMEWLVLWTGEILSKSRPRVADGRTPYEVMTGHRCKHPMLGIGEVVAFRIVVDKTRRHKADGDWREGVFLGIDTRSTQFLVGTKGGLFKTSYHEVKRLTKEKAYQATYLDEITTTVEEYILKGASAEYGPMGPSTGITGGEQGGRGDNNDKGFAPRSFRITYDDGVKYGFTDGCPGRVWLQNRLGPRRGHTIECRSRFTNLMGDDDVDKDRVERATARQTEWIAKEVETADQNPGNDKVPEEQGEEKTGGDDEEMAKECEEDDAANEDSEDTSEAMMDDGQQDETMNEGDAAEEDNDNMNYDRRTTIHPEFPPHHHEGDARTNARFKLLNRPRHVSHDLLVPGHQSFPLVTPRLP